MLWVAALLWAAVPVVYPWVRELLTRMGPYRDDGEAYGDSVIYGMVRLYSGGDLLAPAGWVNRYVHDSPALALGAAPYVLFGLGVCLLAARLGRPGTGRTVAGLLAAVLSLVYALRPLLFLVYAATGHTEPWGPLWSLSSWIGGDLHQLVAAVLMVFALRGRRTARRRGRILRTPLTVPAVLAVVLLPTGDVPPGRVTVPDCSFSPDEIRDPPSGWDLFMCGAREYRGDGPLLAMPDRELVANARHLCEAVTRHGGDIRAAGVRAAADEMTRPILDLLYPVCPAVREAEEAVWTEAGRGAACDGLPPHRPRIAPVERGSTDAGMESTLLLHERILSKEPPSLDEARAEAGENGVVGATTGTVVVTAVRGRATVCLRGEAYGRRPPVETGGWDRVVEVGYLSPLGDLRFVDGEPLLPRLTSDGPGRYRVRVYVRRGAADVDRGKPGVPGEILVMVYPGGEEEPVVYRTD